MLVLTRRVGEEIVFAGDIRVTVLRVHGNKVRLGIAAPATVRVARGELQARDAQNSAGWDGRRQACACGRDD
jgi:carbon storage regulator